MTQTSEHSFSSSADRTNQPIVWTELGVSGFKSFAEETRIKLGGLTILAGTNSSGKSSIMQPFLLMKQTLEAAYDPGALLLDGPNVSFTSSEQFITKIGMPCADSNKQVKISVDLGAMSLESIFQWSPQTGMSIYGQSTYWQQFKELDIVLRPDMTHTEIRQTSHIFRGDFDKQLQVVRERCFLKVTATGSSYKASHELCNELFIGNLRSIIHVQGIRGNPERVYKTAAVQGSVFSGRFENYVASVIDRFQKENPEQLLKLQSILQKLGLTDTIQSQRLNDTQIELRVGRVFGQSNAEDTVNIVDVGFGVSQVLPVVVALLVAQPGQLVYIEQPEIHLHPQRPLY